MWSRYPDKYGRSAQIFHDADYRAIGVVVRLPALAVAAHDGMTHLSNDWTSVGKPGAAQFHPNIKAAKARIAAIAASKAVAS